jgi:hypothetical protein
MVDAACRKWANEIGERGDLWWGVRNPMRKVLEAALNAKPEPTIEQRMREAAQQIIGRPVKVDLASDGQHYLLSADVGPYFINFGCVIGVQSHSDILRDVRTIANSTKQIGTFVDRA